MSNLGLTGTQTPGDDKLDIAAVAQRQRLSEGVISAGDMQEPCQQAHREDYQPLAVQEKAPL